MFNVYEHGILIGTTELEGDDESMGFRLGRFYPTDHYKLIQPFIKELSYLLSERRFFDTPSPREEELQQVFNALELSLTTESGELIETDGIDIVDYSDDLGPEGIEVTILVKDRETYEAFFL